MTQINQVKTLDEFRSTFKHGLYDTNKRIQFFKHFKDFNLEVEITDLLIGDDVLKNRVGKHIGKRLPVAEFLEESGYVAVSHETGDIVFNINPKEFSFKTFLNGHELEINKGPDGKPNYFEIVNIIQGFDITTEWKSFLGKLTNDIGEYENHSKIPQLNDVLNKDRFFDLIYKASVQYAKAYPLDFLNGYEHFVHDFFMDDNFIQILEKNKELTMFRGISNADVSEILNLMVHDKKKNTPLKT